MCQQNAVTTTSENKEVNKEKPSMIPFDANKSLYTEERKALSKYTKIFNKAKKKETESMFLKCESFIKGMKELKDDGKRIQLWYSNELGINREKASILKKRYDLYGLFLKEPEFEAIYKPLISSLSNLTVKKLTLSTSFEFAKEVLSDKLSEKEMREVLNEKIEQVKIDTKEDK